MGKKEKKLWALHDEFQAMIKLVPKLEDLLSIHKEIADGYLTFRKNGGDPICGIEKHFGFKTPENACCRTEEDVIGKKECKEPKEAKVAKKAKKVKIKVKPGSVDMIHNAEAIA